MKTRLTLILVLLIYIGAASHTHAQQKKVIKTMMIAGQDGSHYWQGACEAMKQILENSGMFKVDFAFTPDFGGDIATFKPDFHQYDLIVINYGGATWTEPVRKNFEKYVADGGGVVVIHSSVVPMACDQCITAFTVRTYTVYTQHILDTRTIGSWKYAFINGYSGRIVAGNSHYAFVHGVVVLISF